MSVDLSVIIPHNFKDFKNEGKAREFIEETITNLQKWYGLKFVADEIIIDSEYGAYSFQFAPLGITFNLMNSYWRIEPYRNYSSYFWRDENNQWWYRNLVFDAVRAMGLKSAFICSEYSSWNSGIDEETCAFDDWVKYSNSREDESYSSVDDIPIFNAKEMPLYTDDYDKRVYYEYREKYRDNFEECISRLAFLESQYPGCEVLQITPIGEFILVKVNENTTLVNTKTGKPLLQGTIDGVDNTLNCAGVVIRRGSESALFSNSGKQLTEFQEGNFDWKWSEVGRDCVCAPLLREIVDKVTGKTWIEPE